MARTAPARRSIRTAGTTLAFGIAAALVLGACSSSNQASSSPVDASTAVPSHVTTAAADPAVPTSEAVASRGAVVQPATSARPAGSAPTGNHGVRYVKLVEPFGSPGPCNEDGSTVEMTDCFLQQVQKVDRTVDALQRRRFESSTSESEQKYFLQDDARWIAKRSRTCSANSTGGSIDQITMAQCMVKVSKERVDSLS